MTTDIHIHLHYDHTPTQELPAIDDSVPSCAKPDSDGLRREIDIQRERANKFESQCAWFKDRNIQLTEILGRAGNEGHSIGYAVGTEESAEVIRNLVGDVEKLRESNICLAQGVHRLSTKLSDTERALEAATKSCTELRLRPSYETVLDSCIEVLTKSSHVAKGQAGWLATKIVNRLKGDR